MVRALIIVYFVGVIALQSAAQSPPPSGTLIKIAMPNSQLTDIVKFYKQLSGRKVWIDAELRFDRPISLVSQRDIPRDEALSFIRDTLRKEGIEIREVSDSEAFVSRVAR